MNLSHNDVPPKSPTPPCTLHHNFSKSANAKPEGKQRDPFRSKKVCPSLTETKQKCFQSCDHGFLGLSFQHGTEMFQNNGELCWKLHSCLDLNAFPPTARHRALRLPILALPWNPKMFVWNGDAANDTHGLDTMEGNLWTYCAGALNQKTRERPKYFCKSNFLTHEVGLRNNGTQSIRHRCSKSNYLAKYTFHIKNTAAKQTFWCWFGWEHRLHYIHLSKISFDMFWRCQANCAKRWKMY